MSSTVMNQYQPTHVFPPGDFLQEAIEERQMTQTQLAERMGRPKKTINEIIKGKAAITPETSIQLERVLGISATYWNNLESTYRESLARNDERERLTRYLPWLKSLPVKFMVENRWIRKHEDPIDTLSEVLAFFGIASPDQWAPVIVDPQTSYRRSSKFDIDIESVATWLQKGRIEASKIRCRAYNQENFWSALTDIRHLTKESSPQRFLPQIRDLCAEAGVAFALVRQTPKSRVSGVARWLSKEQALIQISARYLSDDQLWFTFFHEAGHILLHERHEVFLEGSKHVGKQEEEANQFAEDILIPQRDFTRLSAASHTPSSIRVFAESIGVSPGIVVGRLQKEGLRHGGPLESLKVRYKEEELFCVGAVASSEIES